MAKKRNVNVKQHQRKVPSGGKTNVKKHTRNIDEKTNVIRKNVNEDFLFFDPNEYKVTMRQEWEFMPLFFNNNISDGTLCKDKTVYKLVNQGLVKKVGESEVKGTSKYKLTEKGQRLCEYKYLKNGDVPNLIRTPYGSKLYLNSPKEGITRKKADDRVWDFISKPRFNEEGRPIVRSYNYGSPSILNVGDKYYVYVRPLSDKRWIVKQIKKNQFEGFR